MGGPQSPLGYRNTPDWLGAGVGGQVQAFFPVSGGTLLALNLFWAWNMSPSTSIP